MVEQSVATETTADADTTDRASSSDRTKVILLGQIVVIVALLVAWSIIRGRQQGSLSVVDA